MVEPVRLDIISPDLTYDSSSGRV